MSGKRVNARRKGTPNPEVRRPEITLPERRVDGRMPKPNQETMDRLLAYERQRLGRDVCGAWKPVKGNVCCKWPMRGGVRCEDDGGLSRRGVDSASFKTGIFSQVVQDTPVAEAYRRLLSDKRLMDLREHVGLATAQLFQMVEELYSGASPGEAWIACQRLRKLILASTDDHERAAYVKELMQAIEAGANAVAKREEIRRQQEHIRKLATTERSHLEKEKGTMSVEAFAVNMAILADGMKRFFKDDDIQRFRTFIKANIMDVPAGFSIELPNPN